MSAASTVKSLSISSRLSLGFGCMLVLLVAVAAVGQLSVGKVHDQMTQITGVGANKAKLVNGMLESVSAIGIQSRSAAMLNDIDPKQAREQIVAVGKTLKEYAAQEAALSELLTPPRPPLQSSSCWARCRPWAARPAPNWTAPSRPLTTATP